MQSFMMEIIISPFRFIIRGLVTYRSSVRVFGDINKIFDATICDASGEIKLVAFNEEADRLHSNFILNKVINLKLRMLIILFVVGGSY